ncbi:MAG: nucleotidyltransferase domain-containing protein [Anaerolineae bacterium]
MRHEDFWREIFTYHNCRFAHLFGSLARQTVRSPAFDIDLAVQSSPDKFLLLVAAALESDFKVDMVDLTSASPSLSQFIAQDGIVLYEKR